MAIYTGVNGVARNVKGIYIGVNGVARKVKKAYIGVNGVARLFYSSGLPLADLPVGTLVKLKEGGVLVNYRIVHQGLPSSMYDSSCNGTWLLREEIHSNMIYHSTYNNYKNSNIHTWLNGAFFETIDSGVQNIIKQVKIPYVNGNGKGGSVASGANGLSTKVFLLSCYEVGWTKSNNQYYPQDGACLKYFEGTAANDNKRISYYNGVASEWWTRSPYTSYYNSVVCVRTGSGGALDVNREHSVRPAFVLPTDAMVSSSPNADGSYTLLV